MPHRPQSESRKLLQRLRDILAAPGSGQDRLDSITHHIADSMETQVCSIYLFRDADTLELCATEGLRPDAVHKTRLRLGEGLVGRVARRGAPLSTRDSSLHPGFRYMPETGEEVFPAFLGVPIQRVGERLGVLVVQSSDKREYTDDEVYGLEVVAMVLAEMAELGAFLGQSSDNLPLVHRFPLLVRGASGHEGTAEGSVWLHEPRVMITNPVADDPERERERLRAAVQGLRRNVDLLLAQADLADQGDHTDVLETYRMFANSRGWLTRMEDAINLGLSAEAAVEKEQSTARARLERAGDQYLRDRLHDLDDLSNRLLRILTGQGDETGAMMPENPVLVARNIGPAELLDYGRRLRGVVLEEGSVGSHAAIVARALAIPLVIQARRITTEALNGDQVLVDGDNGIVHLRPEESVVSAFRDKIAMRRAAHSRYADLRDVPATALCGTTISMYMNAGLLADLPSLADSGAEGVGLFRTELQFLTRRTVPRRDELSRLYARVIENAGGRPVTFRTLDIGSDKVLPYMKPQDEPNPAMGWRAIRVGLDRRGVLRMQLQALIRAANGGPLTVMFPFITVPAEFTLAREILLKEVERSEHFGHPTPSELRIGAMIETPSLAFAPVSFYQQCDFVSVGGNDLKQFFFAADRENELVRKRYDSTSGAYVAMLQQIVDRALEAGTALSFCGEDASRPVEALMLTAMGFPCLSMRPAAIGPIKHLIRQTNLVSLKTKINEALTDGAPVLRPLLLRALAEG